MYIESVLYSQSAIPSTPKKSIQTNFNSYLSKSHINFSIDKSYFIITHVILLLNRFEKLKEEWLNDIKLHSSLSEKYYHTAYKKIIEMGVDVLPFIFNDLINNDNYWFKALKEITGVEVVTQNIQGDFTKIKHEWINWGKSKGYIL